MKVCFDRPTDEVIAEVLHDQPDVRDALVMAWDEAWKATDPILLELCRLRIAKLLGCEAELMSRIPQAEAAGLDESMVDVLSQWPTDPSFEGAARACLAFAEQFVIDVASMSDAIADAVRKHLGEQGLVDFTSALLVVEQRQRLRLIWQRLFEER